MSISADDLKPCPFCGAPPAVDDYLVDEDTIGEYFIACMNKECWAMPGVSGDTEDETTARWNLRADL